MITVIIPALNEEKTIASVVKYCQSKSTVTEIIVVDDDSNDGTDELCKKLLKEQENLKFF